MDIPSYLYGTNDELQRFFELLVRQLQNGLGQNGFTVSPLSAANVTTVTSYLYTPVLPPGTMWFNSTLNKMQFITVAAVPSTLTNATIETITSV